jgi:hypothetical protein
MNFVLNYFETLKVRDRLVKKHETAAETKFARSTLIKIARSTDCLEGGDAEAVFKEKHGVWDHIPELTITHHIP